MRLNKLTSLFCKNIPDQLESGILYISEEYNVSIHLCACGCGNKTVIPFKDREDGMFWAMTRNGDNVTFRPSIGNWQLPCRSHYFITNNAIDWRK
jgi:hypothetical protein